jgi:hypothetical protein
MILSLFLKYNYELQSVDFHNNKSKPNSTTCELCYTQNSKMEFNHSHYKNDTLNLDLEKFMCDKCNKKLKLKINQLISMLLILKTMIIPS